jgi:hypothetical protein
MVELVSTLIRFALMCLAISCFVAYRSRANYEFWLKHRRLVYLNSAHSMHSISRTAFNVGRWSLLMAFGSFMMLVINQ